MPTAGQRVRAIDFPTSVTDTQNDTGTTTSTTYTATLTGTGATTCSAVFLAPKSGRVMVASNTTLSSDSSSNTAACGWELREGGTVGSGTITVSANNARAVRHAGTSLERQGITEMVTGLTAGSTYNVRQMFATTAGTGTFLNKTLNVFPLP